MVSNLLKRFNLLTILIVWRVMTFIPLVVAAYIIPVNKSPVSYIYSYIDSTISINSIFLYPWANFDGIHYLNIAWFGYTNQARFFPLFPLILRVFNTLELNIVLATLIFFTAVYFFKKLVALDFSNQIAMRSVIYLLLFATSFFFVGIYSEGLFLLLVVLTFYFARKKMWFISILCAVLLMATRFVGVAIFPALIFEFVTNEKKLKKIVLFLLVPSGLLAYSVFNFYKWHNFFYFIQAQGELGNNRSVNSIVLFPQTIFRYAKILSTISISSYGWTIAFLELGTFLFASFFLYIAWKKKIRISYLIFAFINFAIIVSTGTFSAMPRYVLTVFPIFIAMALIENKVFRLAYITVSPVMFFILLMLFSRGYFVA